ncbi:chorismate mutase [Prodigiosinella aquatilis]|nr:chorismate mutase [Prodigiosinella sp. LS101]WJV54354.1 chorismate mutase [Prodigiosinella sp. LS101]WJV58715.1 chorismate mutase [Pectobacteriaceae bacterium C111]
MLRKMCLLTCLISTSVLASAAPDLSSLIDQRLSYMKDVAGYKAEHHLAIEDLQQEAKVLEAGRQQATQYGLDANSITPFIQTQMDAAKAIQYRYRADWLSVPEHGWHPRPLADIRVQLGKLNGSILQQIAQTLHKDGNMNSLTHSHFMHVISQKNLSNHDKERLLSALKQAKLKKD